MIASTSHKTIQGVTRHGDVVHQYQQMASEEGFGNVSRTWWEKTISLDDELERLASTKSRREDITATLGRIEPDFVEERFCLNVDGRCIYPDSYAVGQLGTIVGIGSHYPRCLLESNLPGSAELSAHVFAHHWLCSDQSRRYVFRIQDEEILRGILPEGHHLIRNRWYLRLIKRAIPDARLSHWRGDDYTLYGNVLIPDTIREESDSDYGAMVSLSNCEIGKRRLMQQPSLFRAICMNGCIWDQAKGHAFKQPRGLFDLSMLERALIENIQEQIPLATAGLNRLLQTRTFETEVSMKAVFAQVCKDFRVPKDLASSVLRAWWKESRTTPDLRNTLFGVINAFTRAGQAQDNETWVKFDRIGGTLAGLERTQWDDVVSRAGRLKGKDVDKSFRRTALESSDIVSA